MRQGDLVGRLKPGMLADFIVLDRNLFEIRADQIGETKVLATFLEGEEVHRAGEF